MAYPRYVLARGFKVIRLAAATTSINTSSLWVNLSTHVASAIDIVLSAEAGDVIGAEIGAYWANQNVSAMLDVATIVGGSVSSLFSSGTSTPGTNGVAMWRGMNGAQWEPVAGCAYHTLTSGDISSGTVTLRPQVLTGSARSLIHENGFWSAFNLGPADPN